MLTIPALVTGSKLDGIPGLLFVWQDECVLPLFVAAIFVLPEARDVQASWEIGWGGHWSVPAVIGLSMLLLCFVGHSVVMEGYDLTRDEQMATFDAIIFQHGRVFWPIEPNWRPFAASLNQIFILPIGDHEGWVSSYLPINAAFRALVGLAADPALTPPLFVAVGAFALWRVGQRLWPGDIGARLVAMTLYAGSSQVVVTGMTAFAATAHLGLNLLWLAFYLRGRAGGHGGALAVGFLATGLHQPLFHPVFAAPFILVLVFQRRWRAFWAYATGYMLIGAIWFVWPLWVASHGTGPVPADGALGANYADRMMAILKWVDAGAVWLMALNLLGFICWQHLLLLPLAAAGFVVARQGDLMARALAAGPVLVAILMLVLLPSQGIGWGYRYLHGFIGSLCLLGGYGWRALATASLQRAFAYGSAFTFLVLLPLHLWIAHDRITPAATVDRMIRNSGAGLAIVNDQAAPFAWGLVINRPALDQTPIRLMALGLRPDQLAGLCETRSILFIGADELRPISTYFSYKPPPSPEFTALEEAARMAHCRLVTP